MLWGGDPGWRFAPFLLRDKSYVLFFAVHGSGDAAKFARLLFLLADLGKGGPAGRNRRKSLLRRNDYGTSAIGDQLAENRRNLPDFDGGFGRFL